ncbi:MAG: YicC family protein [Lentimicrobiaceae bacterium]|nr:YicC family protein [Lentimicrobiaceae bacterium]
MIKSMTGYGKEDVETGGGIVHVEVRTLNSKQSDISLKTPGRFREKDLEIRSLLADRLERGKIDLNLGIENGTGENHFTLNRNAAIRYWNEMRGLASEIREEDFNSYLPLLIRLPDVFTPNKEEINPEEWEKIRLAIIKAIDRVDQFRIQEGHILQLDMEQRIRMILGYLGQVDSFESGRILSIKDRLQKNLSEIIDQTRIDTNRFEQELLYYLDRIDISEEKVRLKKHCDYFLQTMTEEDHNGKKLTFITQEIGREINTLGAKANEVNIQKLVVQMKDELEKVKEQLSNVL